LYPAIIVLIVSTLSFPKGFGMFMAGQLTSKEAVVDFFSNTTWTAAIQSEQAEKIASHWRSEYSNVYVTLVIFIIIKFILTAICIALPIPAGAFFPVFLIGAAYGRLVGECMATWFPNGIRTGSTFSPVLPGGYAVVGAAAMAGAVTHTISTSVIVFELTGQITHILPVMVAVLVANAVVQPLQPSIYDSIIEIKKLPNLPDMKRSRHYNVTAGDIMVTNVVFISTKSTYMDLRELLRMSKLNSFSLVDSPISMILLGSIQRPQLEWLLQRHLINAQTRDQAEPESGDLGDLQSPRHASVHFSSGEVSMNIPAGGVPHKSAIKKIGKKLPSATPVSIQKLFNTSTSEMGESTIADMTVDANDLPQWEVALLHELVDFTDCQIDPAPFQLVEKASLYKVHKLFCLLNLTHAYVTTIGRLVGIVSLDELRAAIEDERPYMQRRLTRLQSVNDNDDTYFDDNRSQSSVGGKSRAYSEPAPHSVTDQSIGGFSLPPLRLNK